MASDVSTKIAAGVLCGESSITNVPNAGTEEMAEAADKMLAEWDKRFGGSHEAK